MSVNAATASAPTYEELRAELARKDAELAQVRAENARLRDENTQLTLKLRACQKRTTWTRELMANTSLGSGEKVTLVALRDVQAMAASDRNEPQSDPDDMETDPDPEHTDVWKVAQRAGMSSQAAGDNLRKLAIAGAAKRVEHKKRGDYGQPITEVHVAPTLAALRAPRTIAYPEELQPNRGGKRVQCPSCKSENLRRRVVCADCGTVLSDKPVNEPDEAAQPLKYSPVGQIDLPCGPGLLEPTSEPTSEPATPYPLDQVAAGRRAAARSSREACQHPRHAVRFLPQAQKWRCGHCNENVPEPPDGQVVVWPERPKATRTPVTA